jgi:hypothetical protein
MTDKPWKKRLRKRIPVRFGVEAPTKIAFTDNVTREGLFIQSALVVKPGTQLLVELTPPEGKVLIEAEVRWAKKIHPHMLHKLKGGIGLRILAFREGEETYRQVCDALYVRDPGDIL